MKLIALILLLSLLTACGAKATPTEETGLSNVQLFTKTWEFQNTGSCEWTESYLITFVSGTDMDGEDAETADTVAVGANGEISVSLVTPDSEGTYTGYWRLADEDGNAFGQSVYVQIVVSEDSSTLTPTPTATSEPTSTATPVPTSTDLPTATPTVSG